MMQLPGWKIYNRPGQFITGPPAAQTAPLLNVNSLATRLKLQRPAVLRCLPVLERLFLVRRPRAWSRNPSKKLAAAPKARMIDSGIAASPAELRATDWIDNRGPRAFPPPPSCSYAAAWASARNPPFHTKPGKP